jgi:hypothetical protein
MMIQITTLLITETTKTPNQMKQQGGTTFKEKKKGEAEHVKWMIRTNLRNFDTH